MKQSFYKWKLISLNKTFSNKQSGKIMLTEDSNIANYNFKIEIINFEHIRQCQVLQMKKCKSQKTNLKQKKSTYQQFTEAQTLITPYMQKKQLYFNIKQKETST